MNTHISERFKGGRPRPKPSSSSHYTDSASFSLNKDILKYIDEADFKVKAAEPGDWRGLPEVPTNDEISMTADDEVSLPPNKPRGKFKSRDKYLKTQYSLQREDAVSPLRDAVDRFRKDPGMMDDSTLSVYEKVHIVGLTFSQLGMAARIEFSTARAGRHILWQASKRLVSGSLVALTPADNNFASRCIIALVAARPIQGLQQEPPQIDIFFCRTEDIQIDPQQAWIMVEAKSGYYEAYRHTLKSLQKLSHESFPLSQHICNVSLDIEPPVYLVDNPIMNLGPATAEGNQQAYGDVDVLKTWPTNSLSTLDQTQWDALRQILTSSLAVVQGPPGTGKTFCSKVALELIHGYLQSTDAPIIIAAQTNHALDQLLGHVSKFEPNYIRLGGRSTNVEVKKRALFEVRTKTRLPLAPGTLLGKAITNWELVSKKFVALLEPLHTATQKPFSIETLVSHGVINEKQSKSLGTGASRWVTSNGEETDPVSLWVDRSLIEFKVDYGINNFDLDDEDEDLEIEQLKEHEAEHGVNDEEDWESLKGPWCLLRDQWTVPDPPETDMEKAAELLNTQQDLWKIPEHLRGATYKVMQQRLKANILAKVRSLAVTYYGNLKNLKVGKWERDAAYLQKAKIIGLTTTGLSKYRPLISALKPKIVLIEEAAEVLEAPVTVACMDSVEHLILVGDHQQLQGHCSVRELEGDPYFLNISLFERLVNNKIPFKTLLQQRRMDPSFRKLIQPLYPDLGDHPSVLNREIPSWGMGDVRSFFFSHSWEENRDSQMSTYNEPEAIFVAGFYRHLIQNGIPAESITILTFYNGHRKKLLKEIRAYDDTRQHYAIVKTVDSYQGEENDIVILSLARSNDAGKIGFLEVENRVCVALSRAKLGFYLFGNANLLAGRSRLWADVVNTMSSTRRLANQQLPLFCEKHKQTTLVQYPDDWRDHHGGCSIPCETILDCGHPCRLKCHPMPHTQVTCVEKCKKQLVCSHMCQLLCHERCFCKCPAFDEAERQDWKPEHSNGNYGNGVSASYQDVRQALPEQSSKVPARTEARYLSGQQASLQSRSASYLPQQDPILIDLSEPGMEDMSSPGMNPDQPGVSSRNLRGMGMDHAGPTVAVILPTRHTNTPTGSGKGVFPTTKPKHSPHSSNETFDQCRMSPQVQAGQRDIWNKFAEGGAAKDDEKRGWSNNIAGPSVKAVEWPKLETAVEESKRDMGRGRTRYTEVFENGSPRRK